MTPEQLALLETAKERSIFDGAVGDRGWSLKSVPAANGSPARLVGRRPSGGGTDYESATTLEDLLERCRARGAARPEPVFDPNRPRRRKQTP